MSVYETQTWTEKIPEPRWGKAAGKHVAFKWYISTPF